MRFGQFRRFPAGYSPSRLEPQQTGKLHKLTLEQDFLYQKDYQSLL